MKSRTRPYGPKPRNTNKDDSRPSFNKGERMGSRDGGRDRRGGKNDRPPARSARPASERPTIMVAQVLREGAYLRGRVLQRDLVNIDFEVLEGELKLENGDFAEVRPESEQGKRLLAIKKIPANEAATWAAVCNHSLRYEWPEEVEAEVAKLKAYSWNADDKREDWRKLPIVTIDGADARDFDDAVWAEPWEGDGHHIIVAIADVAQYIKDGSALDKEAVLRGNSTYFPDRVIPMLPERLSNDLCSLRPKEDRPVLGVEMWISAQGRLVKHVFKRGCIHSAARLTYEQVQSVFEGKKGEVDGRIGDALADLRAAYATLAVARGKRGALDLDIPEVKLEVKDGKITKVGVRPRLEAHRLIEELMILANVAAATTLSMKGGGLYRIHPEPSREKLENLKASLGPLGFTVPAPNGGPKAWARLVAQINEHSASQTLLRAVLQSQSQAKYDPNNIGHYGLALPLYSHFTSPIRRYADLVVHRALLQAMGLAKGDEDDAGTMVGLARIADNINATERKSQQAEWESRDRMVAQHFTGLIGQTFEAIIISVVPFGCFVSVDGVAEGLLPKWDLGRDWVYVGSLTCWRKTKGKGQLRVGGRVNVVLKEADALGGRLTFGLAGGDDVFVETTQRSFKEGGTPVMPASKEPRGRGAKPSHKRGGERGAERPARGERPASHFRPTKDGGAPAHGDRPARDARPERGDRLARDTRPERAERPSHDANGNPLERSARMEKPQWMIEKEAGRLRPLRPKTVKEVRAKLIADSKKVDRRKGAKPTTKPKRRS